MVLNVEVIVFRKLEPSSLPEIQLFLREDVLQTLMVCEDVAGDSVEVVAPNLQCVDY